MRSTSTTRKSLDLYGTASTQCKVLLRCHSILEEGGAVVLVLVQALLQVTKHVKQSFVVDIELWRAAFAF